MLVLFLFTALLAEGLAYSYYGASECTGTNPCQHNGTCYESTSTNYVTMQLDTRQFCACPPEFCGDHCEFDNPCTPTYCGNNTGYCMAGRDGSARCQCKIGYHGARCENYTNPCATFDCGDHMECFLDEMYGWPMCKCPDGKTGYDCSEVDHCFDFDCENDGHCYNYNGSAHCACLPFYSGERCEVYDDPCDPDPCQNNGTCEKTRYYQHCLCEPGFLGRNCEFADPCAPSPCGDHGYCMPHVVPPPPPTGSMSVDSQPETPPSLEAYCSCEFPYSGPFCENYTDPCDSNPCMNGGHCNSTGARSPFDICHCAEGFIGPHCQVRETCEDGYCQNNASCIERQITHMDTTWAYCMCPSARFYGLQCEKETCDAGFERRGEDCEPCRNGTFKPSHGDYPCYRCPPGGRINSDATRCEPPPRNGTRPGPGQGPHPPKKGARPRRQATTPPPPPPTTPPPGPTTPQTENFANDAALYDYSGSGYDYSGSGYDYSGSGYDYSGSAWWYSGSGWWYDYSGSGWWYDYSGSAYDYSGSGYDYSGSGYDDDSRS